MDEINIERKDGCPPIPEGPDIQIINEGGSGFGLWLWRVTMVLMGTSLISAFAYLLYLKIGQAFNG